MHETVFASPFGASPFGRAWPEIRHSPPLSYRDTALLDLARHCAMRAPFSLGTIQADTDELWAVLKARADALGADIEPDAALDALEPGAHEWAKARAAETTEA